jgi:transcriptional regulator with XRE-family HTH domain
MSMSVGLAGVLPAAVRDWEDDIDEQPYLWSDLLARRNALSLRVEDLVPVLRVDMRKYRSRETGALEVGPDLVDELIAMEEFVAGEADKLVAGAPAEGTVVLQAVVDQGEFEASYPDARTLRDLVAYPMSLQHVAVGRAAAELSRRGRDVEVHRGDRRGDLTARRLAADLLKEETARLLGVDEKRYAKFERSPTAPPAGLLAELQAVDDFITTSAGQLDVTEAGGVSVVVMLDDQGEFERAYPQARTLRDGVVYPRRVHRVAAARRAHMLEAAGRSVRIAVADS